MDDTREDVNDRYTAEELIAIYPRTRLPEL
jgi:hypothetical protein